jgi:hypothetical protein
VTTIEFVIYLITHLYSYTRFNVLQLPGADDQDKSKHVELTTNYVKSVILTIFVSSCELFVNAQIQIALR